MNKHRLDSKKYELFDVLSEVIKNPLKIEILYGAFKEFEFDDTKIINTINEVAAFDWDSPLESGG